MTLVSRVLRHAPRPARPAHVTRRHVLDRVGRGRRASLTALGATTLSSAGEGFFEHEGSVDGDSSIDMTFDTTEMNDLLKSLVVQDLRKESYRA